MADFRREPAHRLFAQEFRDSRVHIPGEGEKDPSYVLTPLGRKVNRLHVAGVCTEVEPVGESGDVWRARISDPTGVFTVYAGQYQPEAAETLSNLQPPCFVAVTGKARTYEPEPGSVFTSVRPESIHVVDEATRDQWIIDAARRTTAQIKLVDDARESGEMDEPVSLAESHYGLDTSKYVDATKEALAGLLPGGEVQVHQIAPDDGGYTGTGGNDAPTWTPPPAEEKADPEAQAAQDAMDDKVLEVVKALAGDDGAKWDDIVSGTDEASAEDVEEALNRLMDKGLVYEPTLGVLRTT